jgi:TolB-like protein
MGKLFSELRRRNVVRVGIAYVVLSWVALQVGDVLFDIFGTPDWVGKTLAVLLVLGFPFACLFAWAFELTPEGIKKTRDVDLSESITHSTGRRLNYVIIAALVVALGYFIWERQDLAQRAEQPAQVAEEALDRSIAVLPFVNMSSDQEQEWFADGLTEEILNALARTPDLLVASRTSSFQFKGQNTDISEIAAKLGVAHVLEGSVRRGGERLRVTAQLIRASDGFHLWSETFDRMPEDVIAIQEDVAFEIASALNTAMDPEALRQMVSVGTASIAAYEAYLEGLSHEGRSGSSGNVENWNVAQEAFARAVSQDPQFTQAWFHLAIYWGSQLDMTNVGSEVSGLGEDEVFVHFTEAIDNAISTSTNDAWTSLFRSMKAQHDSRWIDARNHILNFVREYPNDINGLLELYSALGNLRDIEGARRHLDKLVKMSHDDPLALNGVINGLLFVGLVEEALKLARDVLDRYPEHSFLVYQSHRALLWGGHVEEARRWARVLESSEFPVENILAVRLRQACAEGDRAAALAYAEELLNPEIEPSIRFIALQIMNRPDDAHQLLLDADLNLRGLNSFLNYPYFNHTYFPELVAKLDEQGIERPFIEGPPYACSRD